MRFDEVNDLVHKLEDVLDHLLARQRSGKLVAVLGVRGLVDDSVHVQIEIVCVHRCVPSSSPSWSFFEDVSVLLVIVAKKKKKMKEAMERPYWGKTESAVGWLMRG